MTDQALQTSATGCPYRLDPKGADIQREAAALRERGPATQVLLPGDVPAWMVTDFGLIRRLVVHPGISKDARRHWLAYNSGEIPADWGLRVWVDVRNALTAWGPEHQRLRRPLARAFQTRRVRALIPQIETITDGLLDELQSARHEEVVDLRALFTWQLPLLVINHLFHTPPHLHSAFRDLAASLFVTDLSPADRAVALDRIPKLITELIDYKRARPGDDLSTDLIAARDAGEINDQELQDSFLLVIAAGHETTVNALGHGVVNLASHRDQLALAASGEVSWKQVVEEVLRHEAAISTLILRFAVHDIVDEATGVTFARGDAIALNYAAAGRDPLIYGVTADAFDITRPTADASRHLAFGHGPHMCIGAELARVESRIALRELFGRFPSLHLAVAPAELQPLPSFIANGYTHLPVRLGPPTR